MKLLFLIFGLTFATHSLWSDSKLNGLEFDQNQSETVQKKAAPDFTSPPLIPAKPKVLKYRLHGKIETMHTGGFKPFHDTPSFVNFSSVATATPYGHMYHSGTCYGITYMTSLWYSAIVRHLNDIYAQEEMPEIQSIGTRQLNFGMSNQKQTQQCVDDHGQEVDCPIASSEDDISNDKIDGPTYLASWAKLSNTRFFNRCGVELANCRMYKISENRKLSTFTRQTMIHHHFQQFVVESIDLKIREPNLLETQIDELKSRVSKHGSVFIYWIVYSSFDKWGANEDMDPNDEIVWDRFEAAHAMLLYEISEVNVKVQDLDRKALKLHLYDPNKTYRDYEKLKTSEGIGTYVLYFPDSKTMTFSNAMQKFYSAKNIKHSGDSSRISKNLQGGFPTIDGKQTVIGYIDFYEGHKKQYDDAVDFDAFYTGKVMTPLDVKLFDVFATSETCDHIKTTIRNLKKNPHSDNYKFIKAWFYENIKALQNHLRIERVIAPNGYCDPFE